jgi:hypothetical protein
MAQFVKAGRGLASGDLRLLRRAKALYSKDV